MPEVVFGCVRKFEVGLPQTASLDYRPVCDAAQCEHYRSRRERIQFVREKPIAGVDLCPDGLVLGRQALHRIRDAAIQQGQPVIRRQRLGVRTEAELVQGFIQQDPGMIARKRPPGASPTISSRAAASPNGGTGRQ